MELTESNLPVYASRFYTNTTCSSMEEYLEDFSRLRMAHKLVRKIGAGKSENIRLLCNHVVCFVNNFEVEASKRLLMFGIEEHEKEIVKTILNYLGFLGVDEMKEIKFHLQTAKALKEMDR